LFVGYEGGSMLNDKKIVTDKSVLFALTEPKCHFVKVAEDRDEYLKVWVKEPTWLEVDKAMNSLMKVDARTQNLDLDLNAMYRYMVENFIVKSEPSLSTIDLLRLSPYVGAQIKEILPNPFDAFEENEAKNEL
jgi:hypothetical protein|tara:strand:- start:289 stop:687 length:399 start_codon:yes stop_codon:yes gene_type:complete